ncbi:MAG: hypothetical protein HY051_03305 [Candidatus Aenigmarchaeota archaeon]|nr:hypothetical protein [Candidatus Aenigmarchaeota archaeon]
MKKIEIEDLPGVGPKVAEKLREVGYTDLMTIAAASAGELADVAGVGEITAAKIIEAARDSLEMGFDTAEKLKEKRKTVGAITTGSKALDELLGGGVETQSMTEAYGAYGCLTGDSKIALGDGRLVAIGSIAGGLNPGVYPINLPIMTLDDKLKPTTATKLYVYSCNNVLDVTLRNGMSVSATPNHPLLTASGWKEAKDLSLNDMIMIAHDETFPANLVKLDTKVVLKKFTPISKLSKVSLPTVLTPELAELVGYILAEGWHETQIQGGSVNRVSIRNSNEMIVGRFCKLVWDVFGIEPAKRKEEDNAKILDINSVVVGEFLRQFHGLYNTARCKFVPDQILSSPKHVVVKFLSAFYDGEGSAVLDMSSRTRNYVRETVNGSKTYVYTLLSYGRWVSLRSSSVKLLETVQILLSKFGIKSSVTSDITKKGGKEFLCYKLNVYDKESLIKFYSEIGLHTLRLKDKISGIIESYKRNGVRKFVDFTPISSITPSKTPDGKVYDFEVPGTHNFLSNGIISHNSGKSQLGFQLLINVQLPVEKGGLNAKGMIIDCENTFRPARVEQLAKGAGLDPQKALKNILVARAHNSLPGDEPVTILNDDAVHNTDIGDVVENRKGRKITTFSFNPENGRVEPAEVTDLIGHEIGENNELFRIKTSFGREVTVTGAHSLFRGVRKGQTGETVQRVAGNMRPESCYASLLKTGDHIAIPSTLPIPERDINEINLEEMLKNIPNGIKKEILVEGLGGKNFIKLRHTGKRKATGIPANIKIDEDLLWLLGLWIAEGNTQYKSRAVRLRITCEEEFCTRAKKIIEEKFSVKSFIHTKKGQRARTLLVPSRLLCLIMKHCFGVSIGSKSSERNIPEWIFSLPKNKIMHFIKGFWDGDGYHAASRRDGRLLFATSSKKLAHDITMLLLRFGVIAAIARVKLKNMKTSWNQPYRIEAAGLNINEPLGLCEVNQNLNAPKWESLVFARIKSVEKIRVDPKTKVYDFSVSSHKTPYQNFVAGFGGVCCHNSDHQMLLAEKAVDMIEKNDIKLIVVDGLMSNFRADYTGRGTLAERQQKLNRHLHQLLRLTETHNVAIYVTNQVMARPDMLFGDPTVPIGGHILGHASTVRFYLRKSKEDKRIARLIDSPHLPEGEAVFKVTPDGVRD